MITKQRLKDKVNKKISFIMKQATFEDLLELDGYLKDWEMNLKDRW